MCRSLIPKVKQQIISMIRISQIEAECDQIIQRGLIPLLSPVLPETKRVYSATACNEAKQVPFNDKDPS